MNIQKTFAIWTNTRAASRFCGPQQIFFYYEIHVASGGGTHRVQTSCVLNNSENFVEKICISRQKRFKSNHRMSFSPPFFVLSTRLLTFISLHDSDCPSILPTIPGAHQSALVGDSLSTRVRSKGRETSDFPFERLKD